MLTVGLTGGIGGGKSTVTEYLAEMGAVCVDADELAHAAIAKGGPAYDPVVARFGPDILAADGEIDRSALAALVFNDHSELDALNDIVHPPVKKEITEILRVWRQTSPATIGVVQAPLLVEAGMVGIFDAIVVVVAGPELQVKRLVEAGLTMEDACVRLRAQLPDSGRLPYADFTIINKTDLDSLKANTATLFAMLAEEAGD